MSRVLAVDTETHPFGLQPDGTFVIIPKMICTSIAWKEDDEVRSYLVSDGDGDDMYQTWLDMLQSDATLVFHNAAYDLAVCCITYPDLEPLIWAKLERGEITDTKFREMLLNLSTTGNLNNLELPDGSKTPIKYSLATLVAKYTGKDRSAQKDDEDSIRLKYHLYAGWRSEDYTDEAREYALEDATDTLAVYEIQETYRQSDVGRGSFSTAGFQTYTDLALYLLTTQGMPIDKEEYRAIQVMLDDVLSEKNMSPLIASGIMRPALPSMPYVKQEDKAAEFFGFEGWEDLTPEEKVAHWATLTQEDRDRATDLMKIKWKAPTETSIDTTELKNHLARVYASISQPPKLTATKAICADAEVIRDLVAFDRPQEGFDVSPLKVYQKRQIVSKLVTTELPRMQWNGECADRVYFCFEALVSSGRTSSHGSKHYPSGSGQQIDPRARPCYIPEPGMWLASIDYSTLELCSTGQVVYDLFGHSNHRNLINRGVDLHAYLGAVLARALDKEFKGDEDLEKNYELFRLLKLSDPKRYAFWRKFAKPVGLGFPGGLGLKTFIAQASADYEVDVVQIAMEMDESILPRWEHSTVAWYAKQMGIEEGEEWKWNPLLKGIALSAILKDIWFSVFPEMRDYFKWILNQEDPECQIVKHGKIQTALCFTTPMGMHRTGCDFSSAANGKVMQSPTAEGAKIAVAELTKAVRIGHLKGIVVFYNFIHDEVIIGVPADARAARDAVAEVQNILQTAMAKVMPDVKISTEAVLMERWHKEAQPVYNTEGLMVPWVRGVKYVKGNDGALYLPTAA